MLISLPSDISKYSFGLQAIVKIQGLSICTISKYPKHFPKPSFLGLNFPVFMRAIKSIINLRRCYHVRNYVPVFTFRIIAVWFTNKKELKYLSVHDFKTFPALYTSNSLERVLKTWAFLRTKSLVVSFTWSLRLNAVDLIKADSWQLNSKIIFVLFEFTASSILASTSRNFLFFSFFWKLSSKKSIESRSSFLLLWYHYFLMS